jgi:hypothetical protein
MDRMTKVKIKANLVGLLCAVICGVVAAWFLYTFRPLG